MRRTARGSKKIAQSGETRRAKRTKKHFYRQFTSKLTPYINAFKRVLDLNIKRDRLNLHIVVIVFFQKALKRVKFVYMESKR